MDDCRGGFVDRGARQWAAALDLERGVLRPSEAEPMSDAEGGRRDAPTTTVGNNREEVVAPRGIKSLHNAIPALVATGSADLYLPAQIPEGGAGLHLHAKEARSELGHEVVVRTVADRDQDVSPLGREPLHRR